MISSDLNFGLEVEFGKKLDKILDDFFVSKCIELEASSLRKEHTDHGHFGLSYHLGMNISSPLFCDKVHPFFRLVPERLFERDD